jgi:hypothetical protein
MKSRTDMKLAKGLAWFSIGLGLTEIVAPRWLGRMIGIGGIDEKSGVLRAMGVREVLTGIEVLRNPVVGLWGRVAGDVVDLSLLGKALTSDDADRTRLAGATGAVLGVGLLDLASALRLQAAA